MATIRDASTRTLGLPLLQPGASGSPAPPRFYQRFGDDGHVLSQGWPRITTDESDRQSEPAVLFSKFLVFSFDFRAPSRVAVIIRMIGLFHPTALVVTKKTQPPSGRPGYYSARTGTPLGFTSPMTA